MFILRAAHSKDLDIGNRKDYFAGLASSILKQSIDIKMKSAGIFNLIEM